MRTGFSSKGNKSHFIPSLLDERKEKFFSDGNENEISRTIDVHTQINGSGYKSQQWKPEYAQRWIKKYVEMVTITDFVYLWRMNTWIQINRRHAKTLIGGKL